MAKVKSSFFCSECGYESPGWLGKCPGCGAWNTMVESRKVTGTGAKSSGGAGIQAGTQRGWLQEQLEEHATGPEAVRRASKSPKERVFSLEEVGTKEESRYSSGLPELDRVLGGGWIPGSLVLVGGDPGIGKSTLLLQMCQKVDTTGSLLYVCGEESPAQVKLRATRLGVNRKSLRLLPETGFEKIAEVLMALKPTLVILDSIQTIFSEDLSAAPGSVSQVRDCAAGFLRIAKTLGITVVLVGHVTKEGALAGPRVLEHMVDTVLYFEGESSNSLRILRAVKNRFGTTNEIGVFEMGQEGLLPLPNPSEILLAGRPLDTPGTAITATVEGTRPLLMELQALLVPTNYGMPQRMCQGLDRNRVSLLLAVGDKFLRAGFEQMDAYLNVVGGFKISDTATDLALLAALLSGARDKPLRPNTLILGELGLTGELRPVSHVEARVREGLRLGLKQVVLPGACRAGLRSHRGKGTETRTPGSEDYLAQADLIFVDNLNQAIDVLFS